MGGGFECRFIVYGCGFGCYGLSLCWVCVAVGLYLLMVFGMFVLLWLWLLFEYG